MRFHREWLLAGLSRGSVQLGETLAATALALALGWWSDPRDPLQTAGGFPWVLFAPMVLALRYGIAPGVLSVALLLAAWFGFAWTGGVRDAAPQSYFVGGLLLVLVCGEFSSLWQTRVRRAEDVSVYLDVRLESLVKRYYALNLSHDRLEQSQLIRPVTLRDGLARLRRLVNEAPAGATLPAAQEFLGILAQFVQLEAAGLYAVDGALAGAAPAARLGPAGALAAHDAMVARALETGKLTHVGAARGADASTYVLVAPIVTSARATIGLLAVERMPLFALQDENLQMINVLSGYYADGVALVGAARDLVDEVPDCPEEFAEELSRLHHLRNRAGVASAVVAVTLHDVPENEDLFLQLCLKQRSLDLVWVLRRAPRKSLITLMPLSGEAAVRGYLLRIEHWLKEGFALDFGGAKMSVHQAELGGPSAARTLRSLLAASHV